MMASFSGAVKLGDLNDFIAPSQACVVSLESLKNIPPPSDFEDSDGGVALQRKAKGGWSQTLPVQTKADPIKISLQDCLACSGCVTSAETVLLEHQSTEEFRARLADPKVAVVVTLSQQSVASLAVAHSLTPLETACKLAAFLRKLGVKAILDAGRGRELALIETAAEFVQRYRQSHPEHDDLNNERSRSGTETSTSSAGMAGPVNRVKQQTLKDCRREKLPMLASACPGWVCYAEKSHGEYVLPYISSAKSPQAVMGSLVKRFWARQRGVEPATIYHCAIMPCYDKKLEAARDDFCLPGTSIPETDSVLTTLEVQQLLEQSNVPFTELPLEPLDAVTGGPLHQTFAGFPGGSGGYLEYTYRVAAEQLFGVSIPPGPLPMQPLRNTDFQEVSLQVEGKTFLRFALAYGFRNIQTLLRKVKTGLSQYDYIEVMACPSGCVNGGGQLRPGQGEISQDLIARVEAAYHHPEIDKRWPEDSLEARGLYSQWIKGEPFSAAAQDVLHTQYHKREKTVTAVLGDW